MFVITEMYRVFLGRWKIYVREASRTHPEWFGRRDARGRALSRALDALEGCRSEDAPEAQARVVALMTEMQAFMRDHPPPGPPGPREGGEEP